MPTNSIPPKKWGPCVWKALRFIAEGFPVTPSREDKENYYAFFHSLGQVLPCEACQTHYQQHFKTHAIPLNSKDELLHYLFGVYKESIKSGELSYEEFLKRTGGVNVVSDSAPGDTELQHYLLVVMGAVLLLIVGYWLVNKNKNKI